MQYIRNIVSFLCGVDSPYSISILNIEIIVYIIGMHFLTIHSTWYMYRKYVIKQIINSIGRLKIVENYSVSHLEWKS